METDPPSLENSDQVVWTTEDRSPSLVRSYECNFCNRGFSNAQALGGHMNIHRRDRAKLRQHSPDDHLSLDITNKNPSKPPEQTKSKLESASEENRLPSIIPKDDDVVAENQCHMEELRQLPLFVDAPSSSEDQKSASYDSGSAGVELDLELRLGPEPQETSTIGIK